MVVGGELRMACWGGMVGVMFFFFFFFFFPWTIYEVWLCIFSLFSYGKRL